jgi:hypothetical protein
MATTCISLPIILTPSLGGLTILELTAYLNYILNGLNNDLALA